MNGLAPRSIRAKMRAMSLVRHGLVCVLASALGVACATRAVDLGANDAGQPTPIQSTPAKEAGARLYGCVDWLDQEIASLRGNGCENPVCPATSEAPGTRYAIATAKDVVAVTANRWMFCGARPTSTPSDVVGMEFTAGCRIYFLRRDNDGKLVRGTEAAYQSSFDIDIPDEGAAAIDLHYDRVHTTRYTLASARCPENWLRLEAADSAESIPLRPVGADDLVPPAF